ncbi:hypothetical protein IW261DRAFT_131301 [Armillaria novae-zelandiae]|uniref:C2H2-type domain-containing protein n=1 Tax=Armillaria novae-zelandiae TaxID=153914 RepID=A0AA39PAN3_9AGAR|nr:hypothetical protein IW261DRAFT_420404 [Armillaria novae-zelandiae]KAK0480395.1 hypothetical protein IW261DRAFT_131301 [Armillaria novae-zelandiae]
MAYQTDLSGQSFEVPLQQRYSGHPNQFQQQEHMLDYVSSQPDNSIIHSYPPATGRLSYHGSQEVPGQTIAYTGHSSNYAGNAGQGMNSLLSAYENNTSAHNGPLTTSQYQERFGGNLRPGVGAYGFSTNDHIPPSQPSVPYTSGNHASQNIPRRATRTTKAGTLGKGLCKCDLGCGLEYPASKTQHHLNHYHSSLQREGGQIVCPLHQEKITEDNFARHIREVHHKSEEFQCLQCGRPFGRWGNLLRHMKTHQSPSDIGS